MAKLDSLRDTIVPYYPIVDAASAAAEAVEPDDEEAVSDETTFDDEDFWEAIDMMETSYKILMQLAKRYKLPRRVENHIIDIQQFIDQWPPADAEGDDE